MIAEIERQQEKMAEDDKTETIMNIVKSYLSDRYRITVLADIESPIQLLVLDGRKVAIVAQKMLVPKANENEDNFAYGYRLAEWIAPRISKYFAFYELDRKKCELRYIQHSGFRESDLHQMLTELREAHLIFNGIESPRPHIEAAVDKLVEMQNSTEVLKHDDLVAVMKDIMRAVASSTYVELDKFVKDVDTFLIPASETSNV